MKSLIKEFREFIMRGSVMDMAIGVIIASAFGKISASLVNDVFMPFLGWLIGDLDFSNLNITLREAVVDPVLGEVTKEAIVIGIGSFIATVIDFILIALVIFIIVKAINKARTKFEKKSEEIAEVPAGPTTEELLTQILEEIKK